MKHVGKKEYAIIDIQRQVLQVKKELKKLTDLDQGLCRDEVDVRIKEGQYNVQPQRTTKSYRAIIYGNLFTLFNLINVVLALLVFFTGNYRNMLFMGVVGVQSVYRNISGNPFQTCFGPIVITVAGTR